MTLPDFLLRVNDVGFPMDPCSCPLLVRSFGHLAFVFCRALLDGNACVESGADAKWLGLS